MASVYLGILSKVEFIKVEEKSNHKIYELTEDGMWLLDFLKELFERSEIF